MSIRQKFILLAGIVSIILTAVSIIGYSTASSNLQKSVEKELLATVEIQGKSLDGWIREKTVPAINAANQMNKFIGSVKIGTHAFLLSLIRNGLENSSKIKIRL